MLLWLLGEGPPTHATAATARFLFLFQVFINRLQECEGFLSFSLFVYRTRAGMRRLKENRVSAALAPLAQEIFELCHFGILKS